MSEQIEQDSFRDYTRRAGPAAIGARLRTLSERIDREAAQLHASVGVPFEQRWFGVLNLLDRYGPLTVGELAQGLGITHASVSQTRDSLEREGLTTWEPDPADGRRRRLRLTDAGAALVTRLTPLWTALSEAAVELDREADGVVAALDRLDQALEQASLVERVGGIMRQAGSGAAEG